MTLINIYAPNSQNDRKTFFNKILKWSLLYALNKDKIIIGGDYNCVESQTLDRNENSQYSTDERGSSKKFPNCFHYLNVSCRIQIEIMNTAL